MALMFPAPITIIADNEIFERTSQYKKSIKHLQNINTGRHYVMEERPKIQVYRLKNKEYSKT